MASTFELYAEVRATRQSEGALFSRVHPTPHKVDFYWIMVNYHEPYNMHARNGILFNHEEGETFVIRKISHAIPAFRAIQPRRSKNSVGSTRLRSQGWSLKWSRAT
ncbi:MAG: GDP-mannose 4,6-dehydratase [Methylocella sp.]